jgi:hypothetical protein
MLRSRVRLSWSDAVVAGLIGTAAGSLFAGVGGGLGFWLPVTSALVAVGTTVLALLGMERWQARRRLPRGTVRELAARGESGQLEFKSSARYNRHSGKRDERVELAVAKAVAGFLNAEGGVLLIGIADDGTVSGLEDDYPLLRSPTRDAFELWLRDTLTKTLGTLPAASVRIAFDEIEGRDVCRVTAPPAPRPVFARAGQGQPVAMYVRIGNSTRALGVDEAVSYCVSRWGRRRAIRASRPATQL